MFINVFEKKAVAQHLLSTREFQCLIPSAGENKAGLHTMQKVYKMQILLFQPQLPQNMATPVCVAAEAAFWCTGRSHDPQG